MKSFIKTTLLGKRKCPRCKGTGLVKCSSSNGKGGRGFPMKTECTKCGGTGKMLCPTCKGNGKINR